MVIIENKKGWIKVLEAFMAIVMLLGFVLLMLGQMNSNTNKTSLTEKNNIKILRGVETNLTLRNAVLLSEVPKTSNETGFPTELKNYVGKNSLSGEECLLSVCAPESNCEMSDITKQVYSSEILIFSNSTYYSPRKLKIFCYDV